MYSHSPDSIGKICTIVHASELGEMYVSSPFNKYLVLRPCDATYLNSPGSRSIPDIFFPVAVEALSPAHKLNFLASYGLDIKIPVLPINLENLDFCAVWLTCLPSFVA